MPDKQERARRRRRGVAAFALTFLAAVGTRTILDAVEEMIREKRSASHAR